MATRKIKKGFKEMHTRMQEQQQQDFQPQTAPNKPETKGKLGDYIEFEEVSFK